MKNPSGVFGRIATRFDQVQKGKRKEDMGKTHADPKNDAERDHEADQA